MRSVKRLICSLKHLCSVDAYEICVDELYLQLYKDEMLSEWLISSDGSQFHYCQGIRGSVKPRVSDPQLCQDSSQITLSGPL